MNSFFSEHAATLIAVVSSLVGVSIGQLGKFIDNRNAIKLEKVRYTKDYKSKYVIEPILKYLEADLNLAQAVYAQSLQKDKLDIDYTSQTKVVYISALASSINEELGTLFFKYSIEQGLLKSYALDEDKSVRKAKESLERLKSISSNIISQLGGYGSIKQNTILTDCL